MRVVVSGASGYLGGAVCAYLSARGHGILRLVRRAERSPDERRWDPRAPDGALEPDRLAGAHVVLNLSGARLDARRWTPRYRRELRESRLGSTAALARALAALRRRDPDAAPSLYLCASGVGYYGGQDYSRALTEDAPGGRGFLAELCRDWEAAADPAREAGLRVVHLRLGAVLGPGGGALERLATLARRGLGARLGSGRQPFAWIAQAELGPLVEHIAGQPELRGPLNAVAPQAVSNAEFTRLLCEALGRREFLPAPPPALRLLLGPLADELLLSGQRAVPARLAASGYAWRWPQLEPLLRELLGRAA